MSSTPRFEVLYKLFRLLKMAVHPMLGHSVVKALHSRLQDILIVDTSTPWLGGTVRINVI
jgi:hypothetical protein